MTNFLVLASLLLVGKSQAFTGGPHTSSARISAQNKKQFSRLPAVSVENDQVTDEKEEVQPSPKTYLDDGFVFGLDGSGLERPKGKTAQVVVEGDSLETQPYQVAVVMATLLGHGLFVNGAIHDMLAVNDFDVLKTTGQSIALFLGSWILADFGSGVLHWSVDNYGNGRTPVMGSIIAAFQGHHTAPWTITQRSFFNNVYKLCVPFGLIPMGIVSLLAGPSATLFISCFMVFEIYSQEFHKWSHMTKGECPGWVNALQDVGFAVKRQPHALHHKEPYEGNYCIVSGACNEALDQSGIFRRMEHLIYNWNGVESNAWKLDAELKERTLNGDYSFVLPAAKRKA